MAPEIRTVRPEEFEAFMRYVERAFGHSKAFFQRAYPQLYQPTEQALSWAYMIEEDGEIVSHVGVYHIETVTAGVRLTVGEIGAVCTAARARGKGYMTQILYHIIDEMRRIGDPVSWLGGDRLRYNTFGWEIASPSYNLRFSQRSLKWHNVQPAEIEEVMPEEALATVERLQSEAGCYAVRPGLNHLIHKLDHRFFVSEDGYAILRGQARQDISISELISTSGNEMGMIRALLDWTFGDSAGWQVSMWDKTRVGRVMPFVSYWSSGYSGMYRINDLAQLLTQAQDTLVRQAAPLRDFAVALGMREHDRTTVTTITVENGAVDIRSGKHAKAYIELSPIEMTRLVLGGPPLDATAQIPRGLVALLPVPCYVLPFDHV